MFEALKRRRPKKVHVTVSSAKLLWAVTVFELVCGFRIVMNQIPDPDWERFVPLLALMAIQWIYYGISRGPLHRKSMQLEVSAFFLCGMGLCAQTAITADGLMTQVITLVAGLIIFNCIVWFMGDADRVMKYKIAAAILGVGLFAANLIFGTISHGAKNWIEIGPLTVQPSELVKIAFILTGAATLERLLTYRHLTWFLIFFGICVASLAYTGDFGTACIFFVTFLIIALMRSGDLRTIFFICAGAGGGAALVLTIKPYIAKRFEAWRHVWEYADTTGYQQSRVLMAIASGGLLGIGPGNGNLEKVFASTTDLIFGVICEEWGLILGIAVLSIYVGWTLHALRCCKRSRSSLYAITASAAAGLMLFQTCLNVFGATDILPLTGVTLPFVSRGGSSMMASWGLLAFLKAADPRTYEEKEKRGVIV
ncbi:Lipid II flippase FtsW [Eubacteriaceae bacterium CHKCI005]|nr:Lipid II flippase FtsW [Eubacteriaceae bacterium CHKCI005]